MHYLVGSVALAERALSVKENTEHASEESTGRGTR